MSKYLLNLLPYIKLYLISATAISIVFIILTIIFLHNRNKAYKEHREQMKKRKEKFMKEWNKHFTQFDIPESEEIPMPKKTVWKNNVIN